MTVTVMGVGIASYYVYEKLPLLKLVDTTYSMDETPSVYLVPEKEIHITPRISSDFAAQTFTIDKIQISLPKTLVLEVKESRDIEITKIVGPSGKMLVVAPEKGYGKVVKKYQSDDSPFFDKRELRTSYDFAMATMNTTPDGLSVLTPWDSLVRAVVLLSFKLSETSDASAIRPLLIGSLKAVQVGDPENGDEVVRVFLFPGQYRRIDLYFREYASEEIISVLESLVAKQGAATDGQPAARLVYS